MAISGLNNYSNGYVNKYLNNEKKSNGKEIVGKQSIDKTEGVSSSTIRKTATDELSYLSKKFDGYSFVAANYSQDLSQEDEIENLSEALTKKVADYSFENYRKVDIRI